MAYGGFKNLTKRTAADKVLRDKEFKIASDQKYDGYQIVFKIISFNGIYVF